MTPETLHLYLYPGANPVVYRDASGRCYGPLQFLRHAEGVSCANLDMANTILQSPHASLAQKAQAGVYKGFFWGSHIGLVAGTVGLGAAAVPELAAVGGGEILSAAATGAEVGSIIGGGYGGLRYLLARSGACGCEAQQWAQAANAVGYISQTALIGGVGGMLFGGVGAGPVAGHIFSGSVGLSASTFGIGAAYQDIGKNGANPCNVADLVGSVGGMYFSGRSTLIGLAELHLGGLGEYGLPAELQPAGVTGQWRNWESPIDRSLFTGGTFDPRVEEVMWGVRYMLPYAQVEHLRNMQGYRITFPGAGPDGRNIVVRIAQASAYRRRPYFRVSIAGLPSLDINGQPSSEHILTHHDIGASSISDIQWLLDVAINYRR
jgi:hypothetical protein